MLLNYHGVIEFNLRPFYENPGKFHRVNLRPSAPGFLYGYNGSRAVVFTDTVEYDHILPLLEKDLENARCKRFGRPHSSVLTALNNLAVLLDVSGEFYRALSLYHECLEMSTTYFCKYHCEALLTMSNLAALFANNGQYNLALSLYEEILAETKCDYSKIKIPLNQVIPSPLNLITRHNIANLFKNNCEYDRALPLYEECLAINSIIFKLSRMTYLCNLVKPSPYAFVIAGGVMNNLQYNNKLEF
jgi:tetratricopeptide (TPR) repeat protein